MLNRVKEQGNNENHFNVNNSTDYLARLLIYYKKDCSKPINFTSSDSWAQL